MLVLSLLISILVLPIYLVLIFILFIFKQIIHITLKLKYTSRLRLLDSADTYWAVGKTHHNLSYILTILKSKPQSDIVAEIRKIIQERLLNHAEKYNKILCSLHTLLGYPYLLKESFHADEFITIIDIEKTSYSSIKEIINDFGNKALPLNNKILWEILVIIAPDDWKQRENLNTDQVPLILRENHCLTDGLSLINLIANSFGDHTVDLSEHLKNIPSSAKSNKFLKFLENILSFLLIPGWILLENIQRKSNKRLWKGPNVVNKFNVAYRCENIGSSLVQNIKLLKREIGDTSFTEIILAAISASLYNHFQKNTNCTSESLFLLVVATKDLQPMTVNGVPVLRNQFGMLNFELPIKVESNLMLERLKALKKYTRAILKSPAFLVNSFIFFKLMGLFPVYIIKWLFPMAETAGVSNLPGFPKMVICNGYDVENVYFFLPQRDQNGIGFSILTYDNRLHVGLTADEASIPSKAHCDDIVNDIFKTIENLRKEMAVKKLDANAINIDWD